MLESNFTEQLILNILHENPKGIKEYELFQMLIDRGAMEKERISESYSLFQSHFLLFHTLYKLRNKLRLSGKFDMEIHCLKIRLLPILENQAGLQKEFASDSLETYYLDLNNSNLSPKEVDNLLEGFWKLFAKYQSREESLKTLGLVDPVSNEEILTRYRELVKKHHPDLGGDGVGITEFQRARENLIPKF